MNKFNSKISVFILIIILLITFGFSRLVWGWTNPSSPPPGGAGTIYYSGANIGISKSNPSSKLDINTASITEGLYLDGRAAITGYDGDTWLRLNQNSSWASGVYTPGVFRADGAIVVDGNTVIDDGAGWHRTYGNTGWYNGTHGGGWWMTDSTYISVYGGKQVLLGNHLNANTFKIYNLAAPNDPNDLITKAYTDSKLIPSGLIIMWSGTTSTIPSGWQLCDGNNGTPNLLAKFVYGVSAGENPGGTGGASSHNHTANHFHNISGTTGGGSSAGQACSGPYWPTMAVSHTHDFSFNTDSNSPTINSVSHLPPYYKIAFICKL